jgi:hypothetical protein
MVVAKVISTSSRWTRCSRLEPLRWKAKRMPMHRNPDPRKPCRPQAGLSAVQHPRTCTACSSLASVAAHGATLLCRVTAAGNGYEARVLGELRTAKLLWRPTLRPRSDVPSSRDASAKSLHPLPPALRRLPGSTFEAPREVAPLQHQPHCHWSPSEHTPNPPDWPSCKLLPRHQR